MSDAHAAPNVANLARRNAGNETRVILGRGPVDITNRGRKAPRISFDPWPAPAPSPARGPGSPGAADSQEKFRRARW